MGMYTEFIFGCALKKDTPKVCVDALDLLINGDHPIEYDDKKYHRDMPIIRTTPEEEIKQFIEEYSLNRLIYSCSYYFGAPTNSEFFQDKIDKTYRISIRSNLKNYEREIEKFLKYIKPYIDYGSGIDNIYAYVLYEESSDPTIYKLR